MTQDLLIASFVHYHNGAGLSHVVDKDSRKAMCGLFQNIGSTMRSMSTVMHPSKVECSKCRKWLTEHEHIYSSAVSA